jgi:hypothetical protein
MQSGVDVFSQRSGFGNLACDPTSGVALVSCHQNNEQACVARDIAPGAGVFEYCPGPGGVLWPVLGVTPDQTIHVVFRSSIGVMYTRVRTWCNWDSAIPITPLGPPEFYAFNMATSRVSNSLCVAWTKADAFPYQMFYRISENSGDSWGRVTAMPPPPAFGGGPDTGFSYYITSPFPFYDSRNRLHILADVMPIIRDTVFAAPIEIWHWCPDNIPAWSRVHRADADPHCSRSPGTNALYACRPSVGEDNDGNLFVAWEQFDSLNVDPLTDLMRADIWVAGSDDNGTTWYPAVRITSPNTESKRYPCIIDIAIDGGFDPDTVVVLYLADSVAGARAGSAPVGPWSYNPMIAHKIAVCSAGVAEPGNRAGEAGMQGVGISIQNPVRDKAVVRYSLPVAGDVKLAVFDAAGRLVTEPVKGHRAAGTHLAAWDASEPGIYFLTLAVSGQQTVEKVVMTR